MQKSLLPNFDVCSNPAQAHVVGTDRFHSDTGLNVVSAILQFASLIHSLTASMLALTSAITSSMHSLAFVLSHPLPTQIS